MGHGVTPPDFGIDDYKGIAVHGKIVASSGLQTGLPPSEGAHFADVQTVLDNAAADGSLGAIQMRDMETDSVQPFARALRQSVLPTMSWLGQNGYPSGRRDEIRAAAILSAAGTKKLFSGSIPTSPFCVGFYFNNHNLSKFRSDQPKHRCCIGRSDPRLRNEYVLYTAHVDHLGIGKPVNGDAFYNGAVEMLRARRILSRLPAPSRVWNCGRAAPSSFSRRRLRKKGC